MGRQPSRPECFGDSVAIVEDAAHCRHDCPLDLRGGETPAAPGFIACAGDEGLGDVIAIASAALDRMARRKALAVLVEELAGERARGAGAGAWRAPDGVLGETLLHRRPEGTIDDGVMLTGMAHPLVADLAGIDRVGEEGIEGTPGEGLAARSGAVRGHSDSGAEAARVEVLLEPAHAAEGEIGGVDVSDCRGLGLVDDELAILDVVAQRNDAPHPQPFPLRCRDLVADALARDLPLELGEGQKHVERQPAHRGRGVELLCHRDGRHALGIKELDDLGEVGEGASEAVDLVDGHDIDFAGANVGEQTPQGRPLHAAAGESAIVIPFAQRGPAFMALARDEGLAGLALSVEGVEVLLEALLRGLAGIDGATPTARHSPKNRGPVPSGRTLTLFSPFSSSRFRITLWLCCADPKHLLSRARIVVMPQSEPFPERTWLLVPFPPAAHATSQRGRRLAVISPRADSVAPALANTTEPARGRSSKT